jgi:hypothetical protein
MTASGDFAQTNNCGSSLAMNTSCTINVTFTPTAAGTRTGTLSATDNASGSPQTVSLSGTGQSVGTPGASLSPASRTFAAQNVGTTSSPQAVTLTNNGTATLSIASMTASGDFAQTNNCGSSLAMNTSCTINVTFTPTAAGTRTGTLSATDNASGSPQTVSLTGTGNPVTPPAAITLVQHTSLDLRATTSGSLAFKSNNTAGNWIAICVRGGNSSSQIFTITDSLGNTYRQATQLGFTVSAVTLAIYYVENIKGGANTVTLSQTVSGPLRFAILEYSGVALSNSLDATAVAQGTSSTPNSGTLTTTAGGDLLLGAVANTNPAVFTAATGYTIEEFVGVEPGSKLIAEDQKQTSAGTASASASLRASDVWGAILVAVKSAAASGSTAPSISTLSPASAPVGAPVTITGANFGTSQGSSTVSFNGITATPTSWSATTIVVPVPAGATTGNVVVTVGGIASNGANFTVTVISVSVVPATYSLPTGFSTIFTANIQNDVQSLGATWSLSGTGCSGNTCGTLYTASGPATTGYIAPPSVPNPPTVILTATSIADPTKSGNATITVTVPSMTSLNPTSGVVGTSVTIAGANFGPSQATSTVTFNGTIATPTSWGPNSISVPVPPGATSGNVVVTVGGTPSNGVNFTVIPPNITSLSPASGPVGTSVTITGTGFGSVQGSSSVAFGGTSAVPTSWSATSIVVPVPSGVTAGNVVVFVGVGALPSNFVNFTVKPNIGGINPASGTVGTLVTLSGTSFGAPQGTSTVTFNGTTATPTSWNTSSIVVPVPAGATTGNVVVTVAGVASNGINFTVVPPNISSLIPNSGPVGTPVTITGANFGPSRATSTVMFNGTTATPTSWSAVSIVVPVPSGATTGNVVVTVNGLASNGVNFTVTPTPDFSLSTVPSSVTVTAGSPASYTENITAMGGFTGSVSLSITGLPAGASGTFIPNPATGASSALTVTTTSTTPAGSYVFTVTATSTSPALTHTSTATLVVQSPPPPSITSLSSSSGPVGMWLMINGTNFGTTVGTVTFNGVLATSGGSWSPTGIQIAVPVGATTGNVVVTVAGVPSNGFLFTVTPAPIITSLSPTSGAYGTSVTVSGTGFGWQQGSGTVLFGGTLVTPISWFLSTITFKVPNGATTGNVVVTVGGQPSNGVAFTVLPISVSLSPSTATVPTATAVGFTATVQNDVQNQSVNWSLSGAGCSGAGCGTLGCPTGPGLICYIAPSVVPSPPTVTLTATSIADPTKSAAATITVTQAIPNITGLNPTSGPVGTPVTITGTNFGTSQGTSTVTFNGTAATVASWNPTIISVSVPTLATTGNVVVNVNGVASNGVNFTVKPTAPPPPTISSLTPASAAVGAGVTIAGTNFGSSQGTSTVTFNGLAATTTSWNATSIVAFVPSGATTGNVVVTVAGVTSNAVAFTVLPIPTIASLSPTAGPAGTAVTITGTNFGATQGTSTVAFNGTLATPTSWGSTSIVVSVPTGATTGNVVVTASGFASNGVPFTIPPSITSLSPTSGPVGTLITITGTNFGAFFQGTSTITFNGTAASPTSWSDTSIVVPVPSGATTGNVVVGARGFASNGVLFTVTTPDFSLSTAPSSVTVTAGSPASYTENITATGGFTGSVSLSITGLPAGASGTFNPNPATGASSALTVTTSSTTPAGSYVFTVTGTSTSPALTHTSTATLVVQSPPDFSLSTTPSSVTVTAGSPASYTENIASTGGFASSVSLSITGLPAGASGTFTPNPATGASSALTVTTSSTTPAGSYVFTVTGTSSPAPTHTSTATLVVQSALPPPPIAFVRAANNLIPAAGTSVSVANMINNASDMLVVACRESAQVAITSVTDTAGNSYTKIANALSTGRESALFFAANVKASSANTISCNFASSSGREAIVVEEFSGVVALDGSVTASANSATTSLPSGNLTTTNAIDLLVYEVNVGADSAFTAGPGYAIPPGGSNARLAMQFTTVSSQGTYSTLESWSTAALADGIFAAFK